MPESYREWTGAKEAGDTLQVPEFLSRDHISILVDNAVVGPTYYEWVSDGQINVLAGFPSGSGGRVQRTTPKSSEELNSLSITDVYDAKASNANDLRLLYIMQEADEAGDLAFEARDTAVAAVAQAQAAAAAAISAASNAADDAASAVSFTLAGYVTDAETAKDAAEAAAASVDGPGLQAQIMANDDDITSLQTNKAAQTALDGVDTRVTTAEAELDAILPDGAAGTFTLPRYTTAQRDALDMTGKAKGYSIHNTTTEQDEAWDGASAWAASGGGTAESGAVVQQVGLSVPDSWSFIGPLPSGGTVGIAKLPTAITGAKATAVLPDGSKMFIMNGSATPTDPAYCVDLETGVVTVTPEPTKRLWYPAIVPMIDGKFLIAGGYELSPTTESDRAMIYDPDTNTYTDIGNLPAKFSNLRGCMLSNGDIVVGMGQLQGGSANRTFYMLPVGTTTWVTKGQTPTAAHEALSANGWGFVALNNDKVLCGEAVNKVCLFDPVANTSVDVADPPASCYGNAVVYYGATRVPLIGYSKLYEYDEGGDSWVEHDLPASPLGWDGPAITHSGHAFALSGDTILKTYISSLIKKD